MSQHSTSDNMRYPNFIKACLYASLSSFVSWSASATTVIYQDNEINIEQTLSDTEQLWVTPTDLTRVNNFVLKPEGACLAELCVPIRRDPASNMVKQHDQQLWFNLTGFAEKLKQSYVQDSDSQTWSFGDFPVNRERFLNNAVAPNFSLKDRNGDMVNLADFRGKKVLLLTWASW